MEKKYCEILGTKILVTNMAETVDIIEKEIEELRGKYICVGNVHTTVMAHDDAQYHNVQNSAAFVLPDGKPLSVYSRKHGFPEAERVTGPDLMLELFARENGLTHYFYGSTPETLAMLEEKLRAQYPHLQIVGMVSPPFKKLSEEEDAEEIRKINESGADIIWVGLGAPKQENWMYEHMDKVGGVMIGVGAGFDYHAGNIKRAPMWMQRMSLEWLYRLLQDPKRLFKRYLATNTRYLWLTRR
ncbi:MAG: WecB/TagA/CpsF family glycosyltransferase [Clostridiales bacterium]|nr:WecB/TagA/CpsF family glycosyltransferase [Roseburia sp.]MDD7637870.1 WecB/TagA/CpsF family glycosyltransferase [Clostridiales bacterium]MDY4112306.1 WecB/TagA/CpsF family glycosyltransferase [Roseburia sp.]